ncbi:MAG: asparagine synthase (glutamine-hydrolyzing), partial [Burkholderiales bacterium]|nr:asparagine synthase (glutamine-hydrolyzing) [Burkholderiales bacterium]
MCGILAKFSERQLINEQLFKQSLQLLNHRGPDENDYQLYKNGKLAMGHTRLSIIGVENGLQPIVNQEKTLVAIVNGEFYDYKQIRQEFILSGYKFTSDSDSEILLALYQKYRYGCFEHLNGEFAGILYDIKEDKLIMFRDRNGVKPLLFNLNNKDITIASSAKPILKLNGMQAEWDLDYLKQFLAFMHTQNNTIFKNIQQVKPAHYMIFDLKTSNLSEHIYWQQDYNKNNYLTLPLPELIATYEKELTKSIARRLVADVPVATYLSGGIDSSSCYGIASTLLGRGIETFTISFDNPDYDEFRQAESLVKKYNGKQHVLTVSNEDLSDNFESHLWYMEGPVFNPHSVAKYLLSKKVREAGFKVVLTGEGSDEYNGGYIATVLDQAKLQANSTAELEHLKKINAGIMLNAGAKELDYLKDIFGFSPTFLENGAVSNLFFNNLFCAQNQSDNPDLNVQRWMQNRNKLVNADVLNVSLNCIRQVFITYVLSVLGDSCEMANSVEARTPFLDHNLIEFLAKVPPQYKINNNRDKFLLREATKKYVTLEHYNTPKHPFSAQPLVINRKAKFYQLMYDTFSSQNFINAGIFEQRKVLDLLEQLVNQPNNNLEKNLVQVLAVSLLH